MAQATIQINSSVITLQLNPKTFSTGSTGYHGFGKLETSDGKYQLNCMAVKIGSKKHQAK